MKLSLPSLPLVLEGVLTSLVRNSSRPFVEMLDQYARDCIGIVDDRDQASTEDYPSKTPTPESKQRSFVGLQILIRLLVTSMLVAIAVLVPDFDKVIGIMGSALCCTISVILPLLFHIRLCGDEMSSLETCLDCLLIGGGTIVAASGTVGVLLIS